jgi:hypothetical protein
VSLLIHQLWFILYLAAMGFAALTGALVWVLIARINRKLPFEQRVRIRWALGNIHRHYRQLYPASRLYILPWISTALTLLSSLAAAISFGFWMWPWPLFLIAMAFSLLSNGFTWALIGRINRRVERDQQVPIGGHSIYDVQKKYRTLYPTSRLYLMPWVSLAFAFAGMAALAISMIFFQR